ncbi:MAG: helix-turn-helix transcriptional regulator [Methanocellales archaeon]|nr:helix-turn-helix transcriptional regulator [Methanocellales archaeon]MDD3421787.1 helix-turn-helix transcriptional regulator [Methanocellales archaeon]MDD4897989.1 helix-turn-helix transcriptional regulator [Methanocellales archaeon]MDD5446793.1 helix-turn-helix transcriptional regulator [Methanocellales archaeon]
MYTPEWLTKFAQDIAGNIVMSSEPGSAIQVYRKNYCITQKELGQLLNLRRETISRIENGKVNSTLKFIQNFVGVLAIAEATKAYCKVNEIEFPFFERISKEFGISSDKLDQILGIALEKLEV